MLGEEYNNGKRFSSGIGTELCAAEVLPKCPLIFAAYFQSKYGLSVLYVDAVSDLPSARWNNCCAVAERIAIDLVVRRTCPARCSWCAPCSSSRRRDH